MDLLLEPACSQVQVGLVGCASPVNVDIIRELNTNPLRSILTCLLSERASGTPGIPGISGVTLNSWPFWWIIIPCMACSRPLCMSNRHILRPINSVIYYVNLAVRSSQLCPVSTAVSLFISTDPCSLLP